MMLRQHSHAHFTLISLSLILVSFSGDHLYLVAPGNSRLIFSQLQLRDRTSFPAVSVQGLQTAFHLLDFSLVHFLLLMVEAWGW